MNEAQMARTSTQPYSVSESEEYKFPSTFLSSTGALFEGDREGGEVELHKYFADLLVNGPSFCTQDLATANNAYSNIKPHSIIKSDGNIKKSTEQSFNSPK